MKTVKHNVIQISNKFVKANCAPPEVLAVRSTTPEVNKAIAELRDLWSATDGLLRSSRDSLYEFLGVTFEFARRLSDDSALVSDLRLSIRALYNSDKEKSSVAKKTVEELLLAASMGVEQASASLRSKYKRILLNAGAAGESLDRESFKRWLTKSGGVVNALRATVGAMQPGNASGARQSRTVDSIMSHLTDQYAQLPKEHRTFGANHRGFTVVLYYTRPGTTVAARIAELADPSVVERAIGNVPETALVHTSIDVAA